MWYEKMLDWFTERIPGIGSSVVHNLSDAAHTAFNCLLILLIGLWLSSIVVRFLNRALERSKIEPGVSGFIASCARFGLRLIVIISAIAATGLNITSIITALGAAGITLGLAMQDSLSNFASGVLILFNHPFKVGDFIEAEGSTGTVTRIELMYTVLLTPDNKEIVIPNSKMTAEKIINYTAEPSRRLDMTFPVAYDSDIPAVRRALLEACGNSSFIDPQKDLTIGVRELRDSAIEFEVRSWIDATKYWDAYYELEDLVILSFRENGISIPFPQVDVHIQQ